MLRHAIFVLVLVGAAFAGGAAINGPGLAWLQRNLIGGPTIIVDGSAPPGEPGRAAKRFPSANPAPLPFTFPTIPTTPGSPPPSSQPDPAPEAPTDPAAGRLLGLPEPPRPDLVAAAAQPALLPALASPTLIASPPLNVPPEPAAAAPLVAKVDPVARLASTGGGDLAPPSGRDWAEIRQRLKGLGVSRYTIDAEFDGRVRFSCVIPVDGLRAVGHHFEADGDDEFQAVEATIRRVTLWRATEPTRSDP